ncbi:hypothetical protein ASC66_04200 [Leifsonia sp. Root4]|uniref:hypothetical protein n=1 Tax=Leifsonia sp. Root4 TaxID=1736525 RepID=UPI0007001C52|nr:hypothetical protein [Leifsonia sp. Root4]KQW08143.1 hypothetical protein ASC66_04200 [Leifsonia sp. Root4]
MNAPETLTTLTLDTPGTWLVHTASGSSYIFDLDHKTVERRRAPDAPRTVNDRVRPLHEIRHCSVGQQGYWTMQEDGIAADAYWAMSSMIVRIERVDLEVWDQ